MALVWICNDDNHKSNNLEPIMRNKQLEGSNTFFERRPSNILYCKVILLSQLQQTLSFARNVSSICDLDVFKSLRK